MLTEKTKFACSPRKFLKAFGWTERNAAIGGTVAGLGYNAAALGSFNEGFQAGAVAGAIAGLAGASLFTGSEVTPEFKPIGARVFQCM